MGSRGSEYDSADTKDMLTKVMNINVGEDYVADKVLDDNAIHVLHLLFMEGFVSDAKIGDDLHLHWTKLKELSKRDAKEFGKTSSASGVKKNISLKNLLGKKDKVSVERSGGPFTGQAETMKLSDGKSSVSMSLKHEAQPGDQYFAPTNAVWQSSDPQKAAEMYVKANKGFTWRKGSNGSIEIIRPNGNVSFEIMK